MKRSIDIAFDSHCGCMDYGGEKCSDCKERGHSRELTDIGYDLARFIETHMVAVVDSECKPGQMRLTLKSNVR